MNKLPRVVTIGGGTGSYTSIRGLKKHPIILTAIVNMIDDGGSSGRLRDELGVLPPGDVRQCLVALAESSRLLRDLFSYRFEEGGLKGHSFGNIFLSTLEKQTGSMKKAISEVGKILKNAGYIVIGPGDLFTSVLPNILVKGVSSVIKNSRAKKIYVMNLMTKY